MCFWEITYTFILSNVILRLNFNLSKVLGNGVCCLELCNWFYYQ